MTLCLLTGAPVLAECSAQPNRWPALTLDQVRYFASLPDTGRVAAGAGQSVAPGHAQWHPFLLILAAAAAAIAVDRRLNGRRATR